MGNVGKRYDMVGSITIFLNLYCEIHEICSLYTNKMSFNKICIFSVASLALDNLCVFNNSLSEMGEVIPHHGLDLHFPEY